MLQRLRDILTADASPAGARHDAGEQFKLGDFPIDQYKPMKVIVIGAGMSGILAGIRFRQYIQNLDLTIYEKEDNIGGTWHSDWSALYSPGSEILGHLESIVSKYQLAQFIRLRHELVHARYNEATARWHVRIKRLSASGPGNEGPEEFEDEADFLFMGVGLLSRWSWPDIAGLKDYKGLLVHSANWKLDGQSWQDDVKDWGDKNVAVIGLGSSALQIVSALQDKVGCLTQYVRGQTWVAPTFARGLLSDLLSRELGDEENHVFTEDEKRRFEDPVRAQQFRQALDNEMNSMHWVNISDSPMQQQVQVIFKEHMINALKEKPEIAEKLIPTFSVSCRRLTPAPGYLKALCRDDVDFITAQIKTITADGVETLDGNVNKHDVIICATGWDTSFQYPFSVIGKNGIELRDKWNPHARTYLSVCVDGFPNCFLSSGPNSCIGTSSFLPMIEHQVDYAIMVARKMQRERLKSIDVKAQAVQDFEEVIDKYFERTVFTEKVRSWYKGGREDGRVTGLWPGSGLHCMRALRYPRWEDYNYERDDRTRNRLYWLGNGMTVNEESLSGNRAWFLDDDYVDVPPVPKQ
ncbi:hypothetical protein NM688_g3419 [Phlebia brevispora]|uniref:Uncharacterized protein n=1 Tax=Phlebia brevispora TaxID=194682 RepID=A0ACC1T5K4_9APHY|nr:hypothetical protein NM688_g3419 [Phlebia brevispora]